MGAGYNKVLLKLSGEALGTAQDAGLAVERLLPLGDELLRNQRQGKQLALVVGGGNFWRGAEQLGSGLHRTTADQIGMLATVMNVLALRDLWRARGLQVEALSALPVPALLDTYSPTSARMQYEAGVCLLLAGGTGNTHFTTDTGAALRAVELGAEALLKATKVDGVYSADPVHHPGARRLPELTYAEALACNLRIMDQTAFALCAEQQLPIVVFKMDPVENLTRVIQGEDLGSRVWKGATQLCP